MYVDHTYTGTYNTTTVGRGDASASGEPFLHVYATFPSPGYYHLTLYTRKESVAASVAAAAATDHRHSIMHTHTHSRALVYLVKVEDHSLLPPESFAARERRQQEKHNPFITHAAGSIMGGINGPNGSRGLNGLNGRLNTRCFPTMYSSVSANNLVLVSPMEGVLRAGQTYDFCFYCPIVKAATASGHLLLLPEGPEDDEYEGEGGGGDGDEGELVSDGVFLTLSSPSGRANGYRGTDGGGDGGGGDGGDSDEDGDGDDGRGREQGTLIAGSTPLRLRVFGEWLEDKFGWSWGSHDLGWAEHTQGMYVTLSGVRIPELPTAEGTETGVSVFFDRQTRSGGGVTTRHTGLVRWEVLPTHNSTDNSATPKKIVAKVQSRRRPPSGETGADVTQTSATGTTAATTTKVQERSKRRNTRDTRAETKSGDVGFVVGADLGLAVPGVGSSLLLRLEDEKSKVGAQATLPYPALP